MAERWPFCTPPIWDKKNLTWDEKKSVWERKNSRNFYAESQFPTPDWGSVGPVLNYEDERKSGVEFEEESVTKGSPSFSRVKNISVECPITREFPCAIPFNIPKTENVYTSNSFCKSRLSEVQKKSVCLNYSEDNSLWPNEFNGRLDALSIQGEKFIVHPAYRDDRQWIVVSNIKVDKSKSLNTSPEETEENIIIENTEDILPGNRISQITSKSVGGNGFVLLRSKKEVSLVHLNGDLEKSAAENTPGNSGCWTVCSSLSSEIPGLWSVVYEDGTVEVHPAEGPQIWGTRLGQDSNFGQLRWYGCEFGYHPMSLLIAGRSSLFLADLRIAGSRRDDMATAQRSIFKTKNMVSFIDPDEQICTFKKCDKNPYVYAILNKTVLMFDIRNSKIPCMKWQHMMPSMRPNFASTVNIDGKDECLILGSKEQHSVCLLPGMWEQANNEIRYSALGLPYHVKLIRDTADTMHRQGALFSSAADTRLRTNMIGMVPIYLTNGKEFFLITLNSPGDLIYQKFDYNRKEEFREVSHSEIEAWRSWEKAISLENSSAFPEGINNNEERDFQFNLRNLFYNTKPIEKKMGEDSELFGDIFDDLPVNYDLDVLRREDTRKALPPIVASWNIVEKLKDKQERLHSWEQRGTRHMGRASQVSMNNILVKNYKLEPEKAAKTIRRLKKENGIKKNKYMDSILRNLPHSVIRSLNTKEIHKYKDTLSLSVLSRWKPWNSSLEDVTKKEVFYGRAPFDTEKLSFLPKCLHIEETERSPVSQPHSQEETAISQVSQTLSLKDKTPSETSSLSQSLVDPSTSTGSTLSKSPSCKRYNVMKYVPKKKRKCFVEGF